MYKQVRLRIEKTLGNQAAMEIEAEVAESPHKETKTHITVRVLHDENMLVFPTDRDALENLYRSLNELLCELPNPKQAPF